MTTTHKNSHVPFFIVGLLIGWNLVLMPAVHGQERMTATGRKENRRDANERKPGSQEYSLEQAISDEAQLHTISFNGLAFITGDFGASTFMPPGKVCDFFGFQYMRDIDVAQKGHNPKFLNRVAGNVMKVLNDNQKQIFIKLANEQTGKLEELARMRLPLIKAFHRQLVGDIPKSSEGLNKDAVIRKVGDIFSFDAELSYHRAEAMAQVARSLTPEQKAYFAKMKFGDFSTWPDIDEREGMRALGRGQSKLFNVAYMTYASEFFSWYAGSIEADTYFCPERHGTYFGGFYMKDMPAMGKRNYDIGLNITGDSGKSFLDLLTIPQRQSVTEIIELQRKPMKEIIEVRREMSTGMRKLLKGELPDKAKVIFLGRRYGELDGEVSWHYAMAFGRVNRTLTTRQREALIKLRNLNGYTSAPYYIYSEAMQEAPKLPDTNQFFFSPDDRKKS